MTPQRMIGGGLAAIAIGVVITLVTYQMAEGGGTYYVAWGLIAVGIWYFFKGLFTLGRAKAAAPPAATPAQDLLNRETTFPAPAPSPGGFNAPGSLDAPAAAAPAPAGERRCPYCAEEIQPQAILCRWCGKDLRGEVPPPPPPGG